MPEKKNGSLTAFLLKIAAGLAIALAMGIGGANWAATQQNECDIRTLSEKVVKIDVMLSNIQDNQAEAKVDQKEMKVTLQQVLMEIRDLERSIEP